MEVKGGQGAHLFLDEAEPIPVPAWQMTLPTFYLLLDHR